MGQWALGWVWDWALGLGWELGQWAGTMGIGMGMGGNETMGSVPFPTLWAVDKDSMSSQCGFDVKPISIRHRYRHDKDSTS